MAEDRHTVVVQYDESADTLSVFSIPSAKAAELRARSGFDLPMNQLRALSHDEAERRVGSGLLQLVESLSGHKLGLRDYAAEFENDLLQCIADAEKKAESGQPADQYDLAILYQDLAERRKSRELMNKAKALVEIAAWAGIENAVRDLEHWSAYERRFERRLSGG
jgi:hypothetical protein